MGCILYIVILMVVLIMFVSDRGVSMMCSLLNCSCNLVVVWKILLNLFIFFFKMIMLLFCFMVSCMVWFIV